MEILNLQEVWEQMNTEINCKKSNSGWDDDWDDDCCCCVGGYSK